MVEGEYISLVDGILFDPIGQLRIIATQYFALSTLKIYIISISIII